MHHYNIEFQIEEKNVFVLKLDIPRTCHSHNFYRFKMKIFETEKKLSKLIMNSL